MIKNLMLLLASTFLIMALGEWLFPKFIGKLPLRLYGLIDKDLRILAQSSKKNQLPKDYIALTGDSYAVGAGDWLNEVLEKKFWDSPDYSVAHLIHKKTGIDVVSFGRAGVGSFNGIWSEPVSQFLNINSTKNYRLLPPEYFLIFFYEGNDVYENTQFLRDNLVKTDNPNENPGPVNKTRTVQERRIINAINKQLAKVELKKIKDFLNIEFEKVLNRSFDNSVWKNMLFTRSILQGISNLSEEWRLSNKQPERKHFYPKTMPEGKASVALMDGRKIQLNVVMMNGKKIELPTHLQAPPHFGFTEVEKKLELTDKSIKLSEYIFNESVTRLASFFPQSKIKIIYIPSPLSSYKIVSSHIHFRGLMQDIHVGKTTVAEENHIKLCKTIKRFAEFQGFSFINTTKSLRQATLSHFIHGPVDWDHFNKHGYQVLSDELIGLFINEDQSTRTDNCAHW